MNAVKSTDVFYIVGKRGTGKSFFMRWLASKFQIVVIYDGATHQHADFGTIVRTPSDLKTALTVGHTKIVCQPLKGDQDTFDEFCQIIFEHGNLLFIVEELGNYCDNHSTSEWFDILVRTGRNRGIGVCGVNLRPKRVWTNFIGLIDHWFIFQCDFPDDVDFLCKYIGEANRKQLLTLQKRWFFNKSENGVRLCKPI